MLGKSSPILYSVNSNSFKSQKAGGKDVVCCYKSTAAGRHSANVDSYFLRLDSYIKLDLEVTLFLSERLPRDAPRGMLSACLQSKLQGLDHCCLW